MAALVMALEKKQRDLLVIKQKKS